MVHKMKSSSFGQILVLNREEENGQNVKLYKPFANKMEDEKRIDTDTHAHHNTFNSKSDETFESISQENVRARVTKSQAFNINCSKSNDIPVLCCISFLLLQLLLLFPMPPPPLPISFFYLVFCAAKSNSREKNANETNDANA